MYVEYCTCFKSKLLSNGADLIKGVSGLKHCTRLGGALQNLLICPPTQLLRTSICCYRQQAVVNIDKHSRTLPGSTQWMK